MLKLAQAGDDMASFLHTLNLVPYSRPRSSSPAGALLGSKSSLDSLSRPGPLIAVRINLPHELTHFDPLPFLCEESRVALEKPSELLLPPELITKSLPKGRLATREQLYELAKRWDTVGKLFVAAECEVNSDDAADVFPYRTIPSV